MAAALPCCSLSELEHLEELHLLGNPCASWPEYRPYVLGVLPRLASLDGKPVGAHGRAREEQAVGLGCQDMCMVQWRLSQPDSSMCHPVSWNEPQGPV